MIADVSIRLRMDFSLLWIEQSYTMDCTKHGSNAAKHSKVKRIVQAEQTLPVQSGYPHHGPSDSVMLICFAWQLQCVSKHWCSGASDG